MYGSTLRNTDSSSNSETKDKANYWASVVQYSIGSTSQSFNKSLRIPKSSKTPYISIKNYPEAAMAFSSFVWITTVLLQDALRNVPLESWLLSCPVFLYLPPLSAEDSVSSGQNP